MNFRAVQLLWLLILAVIFISVAGCASDEPQNNSVRPWNTPQSWEGGMPIDNQQHE
jgi:hypothetical protein